MVNVNSPLTKMRISGRQFWFKNIPASEQRSGRSGRGTVPTIAIVEDDELVRRMLEQHLTSVGFAVVAASDTAVALRQLVDWSGVDLCLIDLVMPPGVPDGSEFARCLKSVRPSIPVILLTGYYAAAMRIEESWPILYKPISVDDLLMVIERTLSSRQPLSAPLAHPLQTG